MPDMTKPLLEVRDLTKYFPITRGLFNREVGQVRAVDGVSFEIFTGECLGLVGESGSGKTTVGRSLLRALKPTSGSALFHHDGASADLVTASPQVMRGLRRHLQMIFQDPYSALNPRMTVAEIVGEPLLIQGMRDRRAREGRVAELLAQVGLPTHVMPRYPHAFSGGQRQRIGIARALALAPVFIVADEPVSALDLSVQAQVLNLLHELQAQLGLTYLFIAHDLSVVRHVADRVAVMYVGRIVEIAPVERLFAMPRHPYTEALLSAVPIPDPARRGARIVLEGEVADPAAPPPGCAFHPRCRYRIPLCAQELPPLEEITLGHQVRCHRARELKLAGMAG